MQRRQFVPSLAHSGFSPPFHKGQDSHLGAHLQHGPAPSRVDRRQALMACVFGAWWLPTVGAQAASPGRPTAAVKEVQLALVWSPTRSPHGFLVSEKFDGVRAVWDGQVLRFRSGRPIAAPVWFTSALPRQSLDGELWMGRGTFDRLSGVVRQAVPNDEAWRAVKYLVFDAPGHIAAYADRVRGLQSALAAARVPWLMPVDHQTVKDPQDLQSMLADTVRQGGEGLMLHRADALWQSGRTDALYKFKPDLDEEGLVVGHQTGKGRLSNQTGALLLETPQGQRFALGSGLSDALRRDPPPVGAWVTYRYQDRTPSGLPRFASFVRVRDPE